MEKAAPESAEHAIAGVEPTKERRRPADRPLAGSSVATGGRVAPSAARLLALQRSAGNRATGAALRAARPIAAPVQRAVPVATGEQLAFAPNGQAEDRPEPADIAERASKSGGTAGATAGGAGGDPDGAAPPAAPTDGAAKASGAGKASEAFKVTTGAEKAIGADKADGALKATGADKADGALKATGADKADGALKATDADKANGALKATGADKAGDAFKATGADKASDAVPVAGAEKAGDALKSTGADKAAVAAKALRERPTKAAPAPAKQPLPSTAKQAPAVKSAAPAAPAKRHPPRIDTSTQPADQLRVAAPKLPAAPEGAPPIETGLPTVESLTVLRQPGGPTAPGAAPAAPNSADAPVWGTWTLDDLLNGGRTALELSRFIPMYGLLGGLAADGMGAYQDITAIPPGEYPITEGLVYLRSGVNMLNGVVGHLMYVGTLIQDGLAGSVVGAEFVPVSAAAMELFAGTKVGLDIVLFYADMGVEIGALWNQSHSGPDQWNAWQGIVDGYQANLLGDVVGLVLDTITLSTAGAANVDTVKAGTGIFNTASILAQSWGGTLVSFAQGMFNVWGGKAPLIAGEQVPIGTRPPPTTDGPASGTSAPSQELQRLGENAGPLAEAMAMRGAAGWLNMQTAQGRIAWEGVDVGIGLLQAEAAKKMAELNAVVAELSGGKNLFQVLQEGALAALGEMRSKLETLEQLQQSATDAEANGTEVKDWAEDVLAKIDAFTVPDVVASPSDFGDGMLADAAELFADQAGDLAASVLNAAIVEVRAAVEEVKAELKTPVEGVRDKAVEIGEFLAIVARVSAEQTASIRGYIENFEQGLGECNGFEDAVNLIIQQVTELLGVPSFRVEDIRVFWQSLPGHFDSVDALAARLVARAVVLEQQASVQTMPEQAGRPDPDDDDAKAGA